MRRTRFVVGRGEGGLGHCLVRDLEAGGEKKSLLWAGTYAGHDLVRCKLVARLESPECPVLRKTH